MGKDTSEEYAGADLDLIEVPDTGIELNDVVTADAGDGAEQEHGKDAGEEQTQERQEQPKRKRGDYQQRINELTREKHSEREARIAAETKAELLEQQLREAREAGEGKAKTAAEQQEQELIEKRRKAEEDGDLSAYSEANDALLEMRARKSARQEAPAKPEPAGEKAPKMVEEAANWLARNAWFTSKENSHLADEVVEIQARLVGLGYSLTNPDHAKKVYAEIDRQIRARPEFDEVLGNHADDDTEHEEQRRAERKPAPRSHIAPPSRGGDVPARASNGEPTLTQHDIRAMQSVGINPKDPKARAAYLKRKRG